MKNFIVGLLFGAIATVCFFIFYLPKKNIISILPSIDHKTDTPQQSKIVNTDTVIPVVNIPQPKKDIANRDSIVAFAKTLLGIPYLYGSTDPAKGFDCSGFITYVFNHFKVSVPRSSYDFKNTGKQKELTTCNKGDLILFTGTNPLERTIGHIGIVIDTTGGKPLFIHSSSGKVNCVTTTSMESTYYQGRFVSVIDILTK